jgi:mannose/cellobiose epimerase-like protein (N-acyl-D-glucosamine 2-epimerase family)
VRIRSRFSALLVALVLAAPVAPPGAAQPALQSLHLREPERLIAYVDSSARFWTRVYDATNGGFYTNVSRQGTVISAWGRNKNTMTQSRDAYAMVRAFQLTGDESFLPYARGALDFMYAHGWDAAAGGWYEQLGETGAPLNQSALKTAFIQHYALLGPMAMVEATGSPLDHTWLQQGMAWNEAHLWDARPDVFGYYDRVARTGTAPQGKSFNATVDALTTHALQLYLQTGDAAHRARLEQLGDNMLDRLVASMPQQAIGFAEEYDASWQPVASERLTIMGHVLKTAWCLGRLYEVLGDPAYLVAAEAVAQHVLDRGYDHEFGGPYKDYDRVTGQMQLWGLQDTTKAWWQMEQAVTAGLELYRHTGEAQYLEVADETLAFYMRHFVDHTFSEVYSDRTRRGAGIPQWGDHKGDGNKAGYHSTELGYYAYLFATLYVHADEATLHYRFDAAPEERTIRLTPLDVSDGALRLTRVTLGGQPYTDFDADALTLHLPPNVGGHFVVGFEATAPVPAEPSAPVAGLALEAAAPNPFTAQTRLAYTLDRPTSVRLAVYDALGREVAVLAEGPQPAGRHTATLAAALAPGVYLARLVTPEGTRVQRLTRRE